MARKPLKGKPGKGQVVAKKAAAKKPPTPFKPVTRPANRGR